MGIPLTSDKEIYSDGDKVRLTAGDRLRINTDNENVHIESADGIRRFVYRLTEETETVRFRADIGVPMFLDYTAPTVRVGFSEKTMSARKMEIWHSELENELYFSIPQLGAGALTVVQSVLICGREGAACTSKRIDGDVYKCDIFPLVGIMNDERNELYSIMARLADGRDVTILTVRYRVTIEPYFVIEKDDFGELCLNVSKLTGKAQLFMDVTDCVTGETVVSGQRIRFGKNPLRALRADGVYNILPYMIEEDLFDTERTDYKMLRQTRLLDKENLGDRIFKLKAVRSDAKNLTVQKDYFLRFEKKRDGDIYKANIIVLDGKNRLDYCENISAKVIKISGGTLKVSLSMLDTASNRRFGLYYDRKTCRIIFPNKVRKDLYRLNENRTMYTFILHQKNKKGAIKNVSAI